MVLYTSKNRYLLFLLLMIAMIMCVAFGPQILDLLGWGK